MVWRPARTIGALVGLVILLTILSVEALLIRGLLRQSPGVELFLTGLLFIASLPMLVLWLYWFTQFLSLRYRLDRNALVISCGTRRYVVPMEEIQGMEPGRRAEIVRPFRGVGWPGYLNGHLRLKGHGRVVVLSTEPLHRQIIVVTEAGCYGISPRDPAGFVHDYAQRRALGVIAPVARATESSALLRLPLWRDTAFWLAALGSLVLDLALFAFLMARYGDLPERLPLLFDTAGDVLRIGPRSRLLLLPAIGAVIAVVNTALGGLLHRWERLGAYLLAGMALVVQPILWLAALTALAHVHG